MSTRGSVCVSFEEWRAMWALLGRIEDGDPTEEWRLLGRLRVWMDGRVGGQLTEKVEVA